MFERRRLWGLTLAALLVGTACSDDEGGTTGPSELPAPTNVTASATSPWEIAITWSAVTGATMYRVERRSGTGSFTQLAEMSATSYTDAGLNPATTYEYRVIAVAGSQTSDPSTEVTEASVGEVLQGNINADRTLDAGTVWVLRGTVQVQDGATLTIEPGTLVLGDQPTQGTLLVLQGGRLVADGTAAEPIVFTSALAPGSRAKGNWGGIIINGRSNCNFPAGQCLGEGNTGAYGGNVPNDDSGILRYARIEWAGIEFSPDNELNALTLNGVGSGTVIEFVQVHGGLDDGIELFGGTVDLKYVLATDISDDSFDWSTGWQGRAQFLIAQLDPQDSDNGWEIDNNEQDFEALPRTYGRVFNFTLIGKPARDPGSNKSTRGILFRRGYAGAHGCGIVLGFGGAGLDVDDATTFRLANNDSLQLGETTFFDNGRDLGADFASPGVTYDPDDDSGNPTFEMDWAATETGLTIENPLLADPYDRSDPDFSPLAGSPVLGACSSIPADAFFDQVSYRGAVADAGDTWYRGWTTFDNPAN
jgi:hypothetical protein